MLSNKLFPTVPFDTIRQAWAKSPFLDLCWLFGIDLNEYAEYLQGIKPTVYAGTNFETFKSSKSSEISIIDFGKSQFGIEVSEEELAKCEELQLSTEYLVEMDRLAFTAGALVEHYERIHNYIKLCLSNRNPVVDFGGNMSETIILPVMKWHAHKRVNKTISKNILMLIESTIEAVRKELREHQLNSNLLEFQNKLIGCYFLVAISLKVGVSKDVLTGHLSVFRRVNSSAWVVIDSKIRMQYASLVLTLMVQFYSPNSEFKAKLGFSINVLADLREVMADASCTSVEPPFTIHQWVFRWFKDKLDAEVFSYRHIMSDNASLSLLSDGEQSAVVELSKQFASYRLPITVHHLANFLLQFGTTTRIRGALRLLTHTKFYPLWELGEVMERMLASKLIDDTKSRLVITSLGEQSGSTAIIKYLASHSSLKDRLFFADNIVSALAHSKKGDCIHFVDDCLISGTQTLSILGDLMGTRERKEHHTTYCAALSRKDRVELLKRKIIFHYCVVTDFGKSRFLNDLANTGIDLDQVEFNFGIMEHRSVKAFEPMGYIPWASVDERTELKQFSAEIGYDILECRSLRKNWEDSRRQESALGYSDFQRLIVFPYNVPKTTLTLLWERGEGSRVWRPLFPAFD